MAYEAEASREEFAAYEAPALTAIGPAEELTLGPPGGTVLDAGAFHPIAVSGGAA
jgi:hypothetical protein